MTADSYALRPLDVAEEGVRSRFARCAGFLYLVQMAVAIFAEIFVRGRLVAGDDAVRTARNILASETLFRLGIVCDLLVYATVVLLVWLLYVILKPVGAEVALLACFFRLVENAILGMVTLNGFIALRLLSGASYLQAMQASDTQVLARLFVGVYGLGLGIGFVFLGFGSAVFSWLWWRSGYIPRMLAGLGIFASLLLGVMSLVVMLFPSVFRVLGMSYMAPMFVFEVGLGLWLLIKGLKVPARE